MTVFLDTITPMNLKSVRGISVVKLGAKRNSTLLMSSSLTGKIVFGCAASPGVARLARPESERLTSTPGDMLLMLKSIHSI